MQISQSTQPCLLPNAALTMPESAARCDCSRCINVLASSCHVRLLTCLQRICITKICPLITQFLRLIVTFQLHPIPSMTYLESCKGMICQLVQFEYFHHRSPLSLTSSSFLSRIRKCQLLTAWQSLWSQIVAQPNFLKVCWHHEVDIVSLLWTFSLEEAQL